MTPQQIIFLGISVIILGSALMVVTARNLIHAALWLVLSLFGTAILFVLLDAAFLAVAQVVIYIGAIAILFIFTAMLTRRVMQDTGTQINRGWWLAAILSFLLYVGLVLIFRNWDIAATASRPEMAPDFNPVAELGLSLVSADAYLIPFEVASILLLAALIGAIVIARQSEKAE
jgi:NADH-quinone oxidoreductase subunit J